MMGWKKPVYLAFLVTLIWLFETGEAIECFQCDSNEDISCPSDRPFDNEVNALIDCNSFEAHTPGQFCMKITQESPGWRGWKKVTRRCGSRTDYGVAWGCRWQWDEQGVFKEICYCEANGCNGAETVKINTFLAVMLGALYILGKHLL